MATKNISRSSLEGGRYNHNKSERNASHRHERSRTREWLSNVRQDVEHADEAALRPRDKVYKGFTDKLNPAFRWLASRCGQPWSKVHSELKQRFDTRSLASWHVVNQHMLTEIEGGRTEYDGKDSWGHKRFFIDENDILRDRGELHWRSKMEKYKGPRREWVKKRVGNRRVFDDGETQYWAIPADKDWVPCKYSCQQVDRCHVDSVHHRSFEAEPAAWIKKKYEEEGKEIPMWARRFKYEHYDWSAWRRSRQFTEGEAKWWATISDRIKGSYVVGK